MGRVRVALCQLDTVVGDVDGNVERVLAALRVADEAGCDLAAFPELSLTGYPPEDLLLKPAFVAANLAGLERVAAGTADCVAVVGFVDLVGARPGPGNCSRARKDRPRRGVAGRAVDGSGTRPPYARRAGWRASTTRGAFPTTACSTRNVGLRRDR